MRQTICALLLAYGYEQTRELETCTGFSLPDDSINISIYDSRILMNGDKGEHTIDITHLDVYDAVMVLHVLKAIDITSMEDFKAALPEQAQEGMSFWPCFGRSCGIVAKGKLLDA